MNETESEHMQGWITALMGSSHKYSVGLNYTYNKSAIIQASIKYW